MIKKIVGDLHNFKQAVTKYSINNENFFFKPRSTYWENLFFGSKSPLSIIFKDAPIYTLFSIDEKIIDGLRLQIDITKKLGKFDYYKYGFLVGYTYIFGIQDLHLKNLVQSVDCFQPIDIEVVLSDLISPSQTLLLPGKNINFTSTALSQIANDIKNIDVSHCIEIIKGFYTSVKFITNYSNTIIQAMPENEELSKIPIRVIFRDTMDYSAKNLNFSKEENLQLERGDIPYFFKFIGSQKIFYYETVSEISEMKNVSQFMAKKSEIIGYSVDKLLNTDRLNNKTIPFGLLNIIHLFLPKLLEERINELIIDDARIEILKNKIIVKIKNSYCLNL